MPTTTMRKVTIAFPAHVLIQVEQTAKKKKTAVDKLIRQFVENSLRQSKRENLAEQLREGYLVNASRDESISEEFKYADAEIDRELGPWQGR